MCGRRCEAREYYKERGGVKNWRRSRPQEQTAQCLRAPRQSERDSGKNFECMSRQRLVGVGAPPVAAQIAHRPRVGVNSGNCSGDRVLAVARQSDTFIDSCSRWTDQTLCALARRSSLGEQDLVANQLPAASSSLYATLAKRSRAKGSLDTIRNGEFSAEHTEQTSLMRGRG
jgi:hypothetical protein